MAHTWKQVGRRPTLQIVIEIPTQPNSSVFADATEWRVREAVHAFLKSFAANDGRLGAKYEPKWGARYDYPCWWIDMHGVSSDE